MEERSNKSAQQFRLQQPTASYSPNVNGIQMQQMANSHQKVHQQQTHVSQSNPNQKVSNEELAQQHAFLQSQKRQNSASNNHLKSAGNKFNGIPPVSQSQAVGANGKINNHSNTIEETIQHPMQGVPPSHNGKDKGLFNQRATRQVTESQATPLQKGTAPSKGQLIHGSLGGVSKQQSANVGGVGPTQITSLQISGNTQQQSTSASSGSYPMRGYQQQNKGQQSKKDLANHGGKFIDQQQEELARRRYTPTTTAQQQTTSANSSKVPTGHSQLSKNPRGNQADSKEAYQALNGNGSNMLVKGTLRERGLSATSKLDKNNQSGVKTSLRGQTQASLVVGSIGTPSQTNGSAGGQKAGFHGQQAWLGLSAGNNSGSKPAQVSGSHQRSGGRKTIKTMPLRSPKSLGRVPQTFAGEQQHQKLIPAHLNQSAQVQQLQYLPDIKQTQPSREKLSSQQKKEAHQQPSSGSHSQNTSASAAQNVSWKVQMQINQASRSHGAHANGSSTAQVQARIDQRKQGGTVSRERSSQHGSPIKAMIPMARGISSGESVKPNNFLQMQQLAQEEQKSSFRVKKGAPVTSDMPMGAGLKHNQMQQKNTYGSQLSREAESDEEEDVEPDSSYNDNRNGQQRSQRSRPPTHPYHKSGKGAKNGAGGQGMDEDMFYAGGDDLEDDMDEDDMMEDMNDEEREPDRDSSPDVITSKGKKQLKLAATSNEKMLDQMHPYHQQQQMQQIGGSSKNHSQKAVQSSKKMKLIAVSDPNEAQRQESYSPHRVVAKMLLRKERKIPGSVFKPHANEVYLLQSVALGQPQPSARVFFPYPKYCYKDSELADKAGGKNVDLKNGKKGGTSEAMKQGDSFLRTIEWWKPPQLRSFQKVQIASQDYFKQHNMTLGFKITETTHIYNSVVNTLKTSGCRIVGPNSSKWNIMWTGQTKPEHLKEATKYQKINHFPQSFQVGRKDLMWKNVSRMKKLFYNEFNFAPKTYLFPDDYRKFVVDREQENFKHMYIMKPNASSCGRGIKIVGCKQEVKRKPGYIVSQYVSNPHLIDGFKYDLRIYALVTSFDPLKVYLFNEGLVRFATQKYTNNPKQTEKRYIHLTNYSVNKKNEDYVKNTGANGGNSGPGGGDGDGESASKWNLAQLKKHFDKVGICYETVFYRIKDVVIKTLQSIEPHIVSTTSRCTKHRNVCFELYGFDILLDSKLKPWLLEVNISPSFSSSSPLDKKIKTMLICDTLNCVGVYPYDRKQYEKETESLVKKRLLGLDRQTTKQDDMAYLQDLGPDGYLGKLVRQLGKTEDGGYLSEDDLQILLDFEEEQFRLGNFSKIFPAINNVQYYSQFFEYQRPTNQLLLRYLTLISPKHNPHHISFTPANGGSVYLNGQGPSTGKGSGSSKSKRINNNQISANQQAYSYEEEEEEEEEE